MPVLPFLTTAELVEQGGGAVEDAEEVPCSIWPTRSSSVNAHGRHHTHQGEAALEFADALQTANRALVNNGATYKIVSATPMEFVPHVVMELLRTSGKA